MADQNIVGCLRQSDGKVIFTDTECGDLVMPACINASGEVYVYHENCDGFEGSDGWYQACLNESGQLQITIPDDCCTLTAWTIITCGTPASPVHRWDDDGNELDSLGPGYEVRNCAVGPGGKFAFVANDYVWVRNVDGSEDWTADCHDPTYGVCFDSNGNVVVVGGRLMYVSNNAVYGNVLKFNSSGTLLWKTKLHADTIMKGVVCDSNRDVIVTGDDADSDSVWKLDGSDGSELDAYNTGDDTRRIAIDGSDNVYVTGERATLDPEAEPVVYSSIWCLDSNLDLNWSVDTGDDTADVDVGSSYAFVVGDKVGGENLWRLDIADGGNITGIDTPRTNSPAAVAADGSDNVYADAYVTGAYKMRKFNSALTLQWTVGARCLGIAYRK